MFVEKLTTQAVRLEYFLVHLSVRKSLPVTALIHLTKNFLLLHLEKSLALHD